MLNRDVLTEDCLETAISDLRLEEYQYSQPFKAITIADEEDEPQSRVSETYFSNRAVTIDDSIHRLLGLKVDEDPELVLDWIQIDNKVPYTANNAYIKTMKNNTGKLDEASLITQKSRKRELHGILIKQPQGSSMPKVV